MKQDMISMRLLLPVVICGIIILNGCSNTGCKAKGEIAIEQSQSEKMDTASEDFSEFIERFHHDTIFQQQRITDVVTGFNSDDYEIDPESDDTEEDDTSYVYIWNKRDLIRYLHYTNYAIYDSTYERKISINNDSITMSESLEEPESSCFLTLTFSKNNGKWFLTGFVSHFM